MHHDRIGNTSFVVFATKGSANRVYEYGGVNFTQWDGDKQATDNAGRVWSGTE